MRDISSKSTIGPRYHVWAAGAPGCYLELLDKLQKQICSSSPLYRYYLGRCAFELAQLVSLPYSGGKSTRYSDRLHDFCVTIPRSYKDVYVNSFFPGIVRLWTSLPIECFPLTSDVNGFKSRIMRYLLTIGSF